MLILLRALDYQLLEVNAEFPFYQASKVNVKGKKERTLTRLRIELRFAEIRGYTPEARPFIYG
jgi:hypothetical protein